MGVGFSWIPLEIPNEFTAWGGPPLLKRMLDGLDFKATLQSRDFLAPGSNRGYAPAQFIEQMIVSIGCGVARFTHADTTRLEESTHGPFAAQATLCTAVARNRGLSATELAFTTLPWMAVGTMTGRVTGTGVGTGLGVGIGVGTTTAGRERND